MAPPHATLTEVPGRNLRAPTASPVSCRLREVSPKWKRVATPAMGIGERGGERLSSQPSGAELEMIVNSPSLSISYPG